VPKRDRQWEAGNLPNLFQLFKIEGVDFKGRDEVCDIMSLAALGFFKNQSIHPAHAMCPKRPTGQSLMLVAVLRIPMMAVMKIYIWISAQRVG
jgi:hypothetical protein